MDSNGNPLDASAMAWDCVRDNVTGLIWEVKTNDGGLRDQGWTYTWYNPDPSTNGGFEGAQDGGSCGSGVGFPEHCNTQAYVAAVNIAGLCGYTTGWRMPTREELRTIVDNSTNNPAITATYFPRTISNAYWSTSPSATDVAGYAWVMHFDGGGDGTRPQGDFYAVRLVRGGQ